MITVETAVALRGVLSGWRAAGDRIALVPTMGHLHGGHLRLMAQARGRSTRTVATIFVNPMQFDCDADLQAYPRTLAADQRVLVDAGVHLLYAPTEADLYPDGVRRSTFVEVPGLSDILCGADRPGHFRGVATILTKLFNLVQPDVAIFGEKDFQQLMVIRRLVADLCLPIEIVGVPTEREPSGLAMSSRNAYLSPEQRDMAPAFHRILRQVADAVAVAGPLVLDRLEAEAARALEASGFRPDYVTVRRRDDLMAPDARALRLVVLGAAWLGKARLIDNIQVDRDVPAQAQDLNCEHDRQATPRLPP